MVQSRFAETRFAETLTLTLTLNPNFGESGFGESEDTDEIMGHKHTEVTT